MKVYLMILQRNRDRKAKVRFFQVEIKKIQEFRREVHLPSHSRIKISSVIKIYNKIIRKLKIHQQFHKIKQNSQKFQILIAKLLFHKILLCQRFRLQEINPLGNTNSSVSGGGNTSGASHSGQVSGNHGTSSSGNGHNGTASGKSSGGSGGGSNSGHGTDTGSREGKNTNVCNEGKDFTVSYNPNLKYPIAAQRLGNKGTVVVMVRFRFNSSGSVSVISASGGSGVFQQDAKNAASRIRVNIKNPDTLKCTISKPFKFELK